MEILKNLLFKQNLSFSELKISDIDSETLSYHLRVLIKQKLISKDLDNKYSLTKTGKQFSADIDVETSLISSRAKLSILVTVIDKSEKEPRYLFIRRLKSPLYGQACFIAGKVKYGEFATLTAKRELEEESGLIAKNIEFRCFHRQFVFNKDGEFLKDNSFCMFVVTDYEGEIKDTEESSPFWATQSELKDMTEKAYDLDDLFQIMINPPKSKYIEKEFITEVF